MTLNQDVSKWNSLYDGWITSGSAEVVRMAFNFYNNGTPSVYDYDDVEEQLTECRQYTVEDLFCCGYANPTSWIIFLAGGTDTVSGICNI